MNHYYQPYSDTLKITRLLYAAVALLFTAALAYASGALVWTGDNLVLTVNQFTVTLF